MSIELKVNIDDILRRGFEALQKEIDIRVIRAFELSCKEVVNFAKSNRKERYTDQTGALNASTGFQLYKDGMLITELFEASTGGDGTGDAKGASEGKKIASQRAAQLGAHICAIIVAGMPYAICVESNGKDVLTSAEKQFPAILNKHLQQVFSNSGVSYSIK
jgi:hypothetical protein